MIPEAEETQPAGRRKEVLPDATYSVLGVRIDALNMSAALQQMDRWIHQRNGCHTVVVANAHGVTEARQDTEFRRLINNADLVVPDGMSLVWLGRLRSPRNISRVSGPDLMEMFCQQAATKGYRHFFLGGAPGVPEEVVDRLRQRMPQLQVVGAYSPPFRALRSEEDDRLLEQIRQAAPDVLWVGLGCPKQERWLADHRSRLNVPVAIGVGAAFDFLAGRVRRAPGWMQRNGLEWLFRLSVEPRRLWRRYLFGIPRFVFYLILEAFELEKA